MFTDSQVQGQAGIALVPTQVSSPESPLSCVIRAVALDWKLLFRALRREARPNLVVAFLAAAVLLNITSSAAELGRFARTQPFRTSSILAFVAWTTCCAVFASCFLSGHIAVGRRISDALRMHGRTRAQAAGTIAARHIAGRQSAVTVLVLLPAIAFLTAWMDPARALPLIAVLFLMAWTSSSAAAVTRFLPAPGRMLVWTALLALIVGLLVPVLRATFAAALPGFPRAWMVLLPLAAVLALETALSLRHESADSASFVAGPVALGRLLTPLLSSRNPRLASYARELLLALRSGRLLGFWLFGMALFAVLGAGLRPNGPLMPAVAVSLLPLLLSSAFFSNLFGADGAGFQSHWLLPIDPNDVLAAKERALWTLVLVSLVVGWASMSVAGTIPKPWPVRMFIVAMEIAFALWLAAAGRVISSLFPRGVDPRRISGDYTSPTATVVTGLACTLFLAAAIGIPVLYDRGRIAAPLLAILGGALLLLTVFLRAALSRAAVLLLRHHRENILKSVLP